MQVLATQNLGSDDASSSNSTYSFFNRHLELQELNRLCSITPKSISVILGRRSSGETALLRNCIESKGLTDSKCFIDARVVPITSPDDFARALLGSALLSVLQRLEPSTAWRALASGVLTASHVVQGKVDFGEFVVNFCEQGPH